ncbi:MAG: hypothetical protein RL368_352 [Pseudomonadota bacterium]
MNLKETPFTIPPKHEHRLLALMLLSLQAVLWWATLPDIVQRGIFLVHLGLFILWQPLWGQRNPMGRKNMLLLSAALLLCVVFMNPWLLTVWQIILIGLMGGRDLAEPRDRIVNMASIIVLCVNLFTISIHELFLSHDMNLMLWQNLDTSLLQYTLVAIPLSFLFISTENSREHRHYIDFFHGLTLSLLIVIIGLGSLVIMYHGYLLYPVALLQMTLATAAFILSLSWLWMLFANEASVSQVWSRHLLNIGSSFELWLDNIGQRGHFKILGPKEFLYSGFQQFATLPWVSGIAWNSLYGEGMLGNREKQSVTVTQESIEVTVYSRHRISGSHYMHIKLLVQILEHFHQSKRREEAFTQQAHLQAIHETGAKLTHDIKNLLQSLYALTSTVETCPPERFGDTQPIMRVQLSDLTKRLKRTLDKLKKPGNTTYSKIPVMLWWGNLQGRYSRRKVEFFCQMQDDNALLPEELFDNVVENLLENALVKRQREPELAIEVSLEVDARHIKISVFDDGTPMPDEIAEKLMLQPVSSRDGFGIGLYQIAKQLENTGYGLKLVSNVAGQVCFELSSVE